MTIYYVPQAAASGGSPYTLTAAAGSYTLTGGAATLKVGRVVSAAAGSYTLTGNTATLAVGHKLSAAAGSFALAVNAATLAYGRKLPASAGSYTFTGNAATLTYTPLAGAYRLTAAAGAFAVTGGDATLIYSGARKGAGSSKRRDKRRKIEIDGNVYDIPERDIPTLLESVLTRRKAPSSAIVEPVEKEDEDERCEKEEGALHEMLEAAWEAPSLDEVQQRFDVIYAQISAQASADVANMLRRVTERVMAEIEDEEDALIALMA